MKSSSNSNRFYDHLAPLYRKKVDWQNRTIKEDKLFDYLLLNLKPTSVLDIGCGDGGHATRYLTAGVTYHGIDKSTEMIRIALLAHESPSERVFEVADMSRLSGKFKGRFDQVIMLGNTLPHVTSLSTLRTTLAGIGRSLVSGGHFVLQTVNPGAIAGKKVHFLAAKLTEETFFAPFYVNAGKFWDFFMPIYQLQSGKVKSATTATTRLRIWSKSELVTLAKNYDLKAIAAFGNAQLGPYHQRKSENMILVFRKMKHAGIA